VSVAGEQQCELTACNRVESDAHISIEQNKFRKKFKIEILKMAC